MSWNLEQAANDLERYVLRGELPAADACKVLIDNARAERMCVDVTAAWSEFGENVFSDDALDDFDRFEKVYKICQEIVEPIGFHSEQEQERTCRMKKKGPSYVL